MCINTRLAERLSKVNPSSTLAITSKAKKLKQEGSDVVSLAAGEPDFDTPDFIKEEAIAAIRQGFTKYTPTSGIPELKKAISEKFQKDNSLVYQPQQIVVSCGAKHSIFNALFVLLNKNDEVLIPLPYWVSYPQMATLCEAGARFIKTLPENNFKIKVADFEQQLSRKTKVLILNSPANPTGSVYSREELKEITDICVKKKIFIISDEIYENLIYDGLKHYSCGAQSRQVFDYTITVNGISKSYSMTGWRIGYLGAPADIAEAISKLQDHSTSCPSSISQRAALSALTSISSANFISAMRSEFEKRRDYAVERLTELKKIKFVKPQGAFYIFCDISQTGLDATTFARRLLDEALVAVIPGEGFGRDDYIRISFATNIEQLEKAMNRITQWLEKL